jgi:hypothetical protein
MSPARLAAPVTVLLALLAASASAPAALHAQLFVTANAGTVRYDQTTSERSAGLSPEFRLENRHLAFAFTAALTGASDGSRIAAGGPSLWLASSPIAHHIQLDAQASLQYTSPKGDSSSWAAMGIGEIAFTSDGPGFALGVGGGTGTIAGASAITALKGRARGWFDAGPISLTLAAEPTVIAGTWYADFTVGGSTEYGPFEGSANLLLRQARTSGTSAGAELEAVWHATRSAALVITGGRYLRDPFQGLPAGTFLTVGVKLLLWKPRVNGNGEGVGESALSEVDFGSANTLGGRSHGSGNSLLKIRNVPSVTKGSGSSSAGGTGRGHKP